MQITVESSQASTRGQTMIGFGASKVPFDGAGHAAASSTTEAPARATLLQVRKKPKKRAIDEVGDGVAGAAPSGAGSSATTAKPTNSEGKVGMGEGVRVGVGGDVKHARLDPGRKENELRAQL